MAGTAASTARFIFREKLADSVENVLGLHDRPLAMRHMAAPATKKAARAHFSPHDVADLYRFPKHATGEGQCIGVIELGGGYHRSDLENFFASLKMPMPKITDVSVDGTKNAPADLSNLTKFVTALNSGKQSAIDAAKARQLGIEPLGRPVAIYDRDDDGC